MIVVSPTCADASASLIPDTGSAAVARAAGRRIQLAITTDGQNAQGEILLSGTGEDGHDAELAYCIGDSAWPHGPSS